MLTKCVIALWLGSAVALFFAYIAKFIPLDSEVTISILDFIAFLLFICGLAFLIGRIIQSKRG